MKVNLFIEMEAGFDTKALYTLISQYKANLLDDGKHVYIYCDCYMAEAQSIFYHASLFGNTSTTISHLKEGSDNGKKEE